MDCTVDEQQPHNIGRAPDTFNNIMSKWKDPPNQEECLQKQQRVLSEGVNRHHDAVPTAAALDFNSSFESLNNNCLVNIFSYLSTDDLNNI
jgi:hypothetical protein